MPWTSFQITHTVAEIVEYWDPRAEKVESEEGTDIIRTAQHTIFLVHNSDDRDPHLQLRPLSQRPENPRWDFYDRGLHHFPIPPLTLITPIIKRQ